MDNKQLVQQIIDLAGGTANISSCMHCATRLRLNLTNTAAADKGAIDGLEGVLGVQVKGNQLQVIIGTHVTELYKEAEKILNNKKAEGGDEETPAEKKKFSPMIILDVLTSIISPAIPAFCAAGMLKVIILLLEMTGVLCEASGTYEVLSIASDAAFYFLPILIAVSAAKRFKTDMGLAICVAASLLYPSFVNLIDAEASLTFLGFNVPVYDYSTTIFPALLGVLLLSYVQKVIHKIFRWEILKTLLVPLLCLGITIPLTMLIVAPLGNWAAELLGVGVNWLIQTLGPFAGLIIGFFMPVLTLTGLHQSLGPIEFFELSTVGYTRIMPIEFIHNLAVSGAALGTAVAARDKKFKAVAAQTGTTAFIGVSEPALYSVLVKDKFALLSSMIGCGVGGFFSLLFILKMFAYVWPNLFSIPTFFGDDSTTVTSTLVKLVISIAAAFGISFVLPMVFAKTGINKNKEGK